MQKYFKKYILATLVFILFILSACSAGISNGEPAIENSPEIREDSNKDALEDFEETNVGENESKLFIHFIDVGQGDAIFIQDGASNMLIDAGDNSAKPTVLDYLIALDVKSIDYIIGTHPHADHIGGLSEIISYFEVENIIMPKVGHTTRTFEDLLVAIKEKNLRVTSPKLYDTYKLSQGKFTIIAPSSDQYSNLNDYSIGIKLDFLDHSFIFTGDAERTSEEEMLNLDISLEADVYKVAHHGSSSSTTREFIEAINPSISIIQVGKDNRYNHPHKEVLDLFSNMPNMKVYRNDFHGNIIIISDGSELFVETELGIESYENNLNDKEEYDKEDYLTTNRENSYIANKNSKVFHLDTCSSLPKEINRIYFESREEALEEDFRPCSICNP